MPVPLQIGDAVGVAVPPTEVGLTATWDEVEFVDEQAPLCTMARKYVFVVRLLVVYGLFVDAILDQLELSRDDCHFVIVPVCPASATVVLLPLQTVLVAGVVVPPTEVGFTVAIVAPATEVQLLIVAVTLYVPLAATVALLIEGFCWEELNPLGPLQL